MSALARYLHSSGFSISGSDKTAGSLTEKLKSEGINNIWATHSIEKIAQINPEIIIYSTAITDSNEELNWAKLNNKSILHRSDLLDLITSEKKLISISGTHGKTTTSSMACELLQKCNLNPSAILGGELLSSNTNTIIGSGEYFVIEADESDKSFLKGDPYLGIITNIEPDHLENYNNSFDEIKKSFLEFGNKCLQNRGLIICTEDKVLNELNFKDNRNLFTYGFITDSHKPYFGASFNNKSKCWDFYINGNIAESIVLKTYGWHNVLNSLSVFGLGNLIGIKSDQLKQALENFGGVKRRFQYVLDSSNLKIIDDYAHHPTEIKATVQAAQELNPKRLIVVVQPHHPKRVSDLWSEFISTFKSFDNELIFLTDLYVARGSGIEGINSKKLVEEVSKPNVNYLPGSIDEIAKYLAGILLNGDIILTMGAGNITDLGPKILNLYNTLAMQSGNN